MEDECPKFRFMDLEIWRDAIEVGGTLFDIADNLEAKKMYRFAEQLRGSGMSMSNNIAEGSGSNSKKELAGMEQRADTAKGMEQNTESRELRTILAIRGT